jgi:hypothetical protein
MWVCSLAVGVLLAAVLLGAVALVHGEQAAYRMNALYF